MKHSNRFTENVTSYEHNEDPQGHIDARIVITVAVIVVESN